MSAVNTFEDDILKLIFQAVAIANIADNAASSPQANWFISLHTADPGETGTQTTSETTYAGYGRATVARTSGGWAVASGAATPVANIDFAVGSGGPTTAITHFGVGKNLTTAGTLILSGTVTPNITPGSGIIPRLTTATSITCD
jgi:hypothetical protein